MASPSLDHCRVKSKINDVGISPNQTKTCRNGRFGPFVGQSMTSQFVVPSMAASGVDMPGFKTNTSQSWSESNASRQFRQEGTFQIGAAPVSS